MKPRTQLWLGSAWIAWLWTACPLVAALPVVPSSELVIIGRGPHHRVWQFAVPTSGLSGPRSATVQAPDEWSTHEFVEVATGMHYLEDGRWLESMDVIEVRDGRVMARRASFQVEFAPNLHTRGAVMITEASGNRLRSHVLALAYTEEDTGRAVLLGHVRDAWGGLVPPNRWLVRDAFEGTRADVRYTCTRAGLEQDVILRSPPPPPADFGLDPVRTRLVVITEFLDPPRFRGARRPGGGEAGEVHGSDTAPNGRGDPPSVLGRLSLGSGMAFAEPAAGPQDIGSLPVRSSWVGHEGRTFLLESVDYTLSEHALRNLPADPHQAARAARIPARAWASTHDLLGGLTAPPATRGDGRPVQVAGGATDEPGWVMDYVLTLGTEDFTFESGTTYWINGDVHLTGTTVLEGGAILKHARFPTPNRLTVHGPVDCRTGVFDPVIVTAMDDDSVGVKLPGSTGHPSGWYATRALEIDYPEGAVALRHLSIRHALKALVVAPGSRATVSHVQVGPGHTGVQLTGTGRATLRNALLHDLVYAWSGRPESVAQGEHLTVHRTRFFKPPAMAAPILTNCLIVAGGRNADWSGAPNVATDVEDVVFQTAGFGGHYLADHSPYRGAGTGAIDPALARDLGEHTTRPPVMLAGLLPPDRALLRRRLAGTSADPDLGYHYPAMDFVLRGAAVTEGRLRMLGGVRVALDGSATGYGLRMGTGAVWSSQGRPDLPNQLVPASWIHENPVPAALNSGACWIAFDSAAGPSASLGFRFTNLRMSAGMGWFRATDPEVRDVAAPGRWTMRDCEIREGRAAGARLPDGASWAWANNVLDRIQLAVEIGPASTFDLRNNLVLAGSIQWKASPGVVDARDNLFVGTILEVADETLIGHGHNGYIQGRPRFEPGVSSDRVLSAVPGFEAGPMGRGYYAPGTEVRAALVDAGSRPAADAGLWHHTTTVSNPDHEGDSLVDIGFHRVAADPFTGRPADRDQDGWPDYLEDTDGNGRVDPGESDYSRADTDGDGVNDGVEIEAGRNPVVAGVEPDTTGSIGLRVFTPLRASPTSGWIISR